MTEGTQTYMPVVPAYNGGMGNGFGFGDDAWLILILLFACGGFGGGFGWGNGGFGGMYEFPWLLNGQNQINANTDAGFNHAATQSAISGLQNSVTAGFGDVQLGLSGVNNSICQTGASVTAAVNNGFSQAEIANNSRQIANMQTAFANQTAMNQGFNGLQSQLAQCCCNNQLATEQTKALVLSENCADRAALQEGIRDLLAATQAQTQTILTQMCNDKIEQKNDTISQLRSELLYARGQASQDVQTATIQAGQRSLANEVEQYVAPRPIPSYVVASPYCCQAAYGCGM